MNTETIETPIFPRVLTHEDRCDGCSAAALYAVELPSGGELLFCGHHADKAEAKLATMGASVLADNRPDPV